MTVSRESGHRFFPQERAAAAIETCLARIEQLDPTLHAFITVTADGARAAARNADRMRSGQHTPGSLAGVAIAVKDCIDVEDVRCTSGSHFFAHRVAQADARVIARLRASGAAIIGKTNMHELAYGGTTQNAFFGGCRNPWDTSRIPGGSSGGSAVAVAAGLAHGALGTDTGSSIRMPAALTGITGLRPTWGSVSPSGILPVSPPHDIAGPMARSVPDVAALFATILETEPCQSHGLTPDALVSALGEDISGLRIAVPDDFFFAEADEAVAETVMSAIRRIERRGARVISRTLLHAAEAQANLMPVLFADAAAFHRERLEKHPEGFSIGVRTRLQPGLDMRAIDYADRLRWLEAWRQRCARFFADEADVMITPTVPVVAPPIGDDRKLTEVSSRLSRFCWVAPAAGLPALTLPCGFVSGLPVGMQVMGARWRDAIVLAVGAAYQRLTDWHRQVPPL